MVKIHTLTLGFANALLVQAQGIILVDTGIRVSQDKYRAAFVELGIHMEDIQLIVITHGHADHFGHAADLQEWTGAPVMCHRLAVKALAGGEQAPVVPRNALGERALKLLRPNLPLLARPVQPDLVMDEAAFDLHPYGIPGEIIATPGHTDCSLSLLLDSGEAIVGDILVPSPFSGEPCLAYFATNEQALLASMKRLLQQAHTFYGGHGGPFTKDEVLKLL
ncbi:hypothetical protein P22_2629 [Propionispora sp. 2/2-37]|uniref:MBL fold metallo-hydrolase n=1 Tax=Propionispora sp. 2/2-37 TaxID=1677858 RepID=UPI0006BB6272|nr:MBL fold metallo-hydrolase [Propionispora sp. 2/2-37]CUH96539.1 hypothetical protein P22_2629 [Propionispora sp. 2/2-37]